MKAFISFIFCGVLFTAYLSAQPSIFINEKNLISLDTVYSTIVKKDIWIYNRGGSSLNIASVGASCGCTSLRLEREIIDPNDSAALMCEIDYKKAKGEKLDHIYIKSNDSLNKNLDLSIRAFVYKDIISVPEDMPPFLNVRYLDTIKFNISLVNMGDKDINIYNPYISDTTCFRLVSFEPLIRNLKGHSSINYAVKIISLNKADAYSVFNLPCSSLTMPLLEYSILTKMAR